MDVHVAAHACLPKERERLMQITWAHLNTPLSIMSLFRVRDNANPPHAFTIWKSPETEVSDFDWI